MIEKITLKAIGSLLINLVLLAGLAWVLFVLACAVVYLLSA
jgi:hypothetical protein